MNRLPAIACVLSALLAAMACPACNAGGSTTELVQLSDLDPRQLDVGDRVRITAQDLPAAGDIRRLAVTLRGSLARPGRAPCNAPVELTVTDPPEGATAADLATGRLRDLTYAESTHRIVQLDGTTGLEFVLTDAMLARLMHCPGSRAAGFDVPHATLTLGGASLRGSMQGVTVRIEGLTGSQAVTGSLHGPVIDLFAPPAARLGLESGTDLAAMQALDTLGITPADGHPTLAGLHLARVRAGSAAERAGLLAGDVILRIDGLNVLSLGDARPPPDASRASLTTLRGDLQDDRVISLDGLSSGAPADLAASAVLVAVAFALLGAVFLPRPMLWVWFSRQLARARRGPLGKRVAAEPFVRVLRRAGARVLHPARSVALGTIPPVEFVLPWLCALMALSTAAAAPLAELLARVDPDVSVTFAIVVLLQRSAGVVLGWATGRDRTVSQSARAAVRAAWVVVPAVVALGSAVVLAGGLSAQTVLASQGGAPWQWLAFRMPATVPLAALFVLAQCGSLGDEHRAGAPIARPGLWRAGMTLEWTGVVISCTLFAWTFLGGWALPGITLADQQLSVPLEMAGAVLFAAKTWAAVTLVVWIRLRTESIGVFVWMARAWRSLLAMTAMLAGSVFAWPTLAPHVSEQVLSLISAATFAACAAFTLGLSVRWHRRRAPAARSYVPSPFRGR